MSMADERDRPSENEEVDEAGRESFPASDAPAHGGSAEPSEPEEKKRYPGHLDKDEDGSDA